MAWTTTEKVLVGVGAGFSLAVIAGFIAEKIKAPPAMIKITPQTPPQTFNVKIGQQVQFQLPVDPTGTVEYQNLSGYDQPPGVAKLVSDTTVNGVDTGIIQFIGAGTIIMSVAVLTNGQQTGSFSWTFVSS